MFLLMKNFKIFWFYGICFNEFFKKKAQYVYSINQIT